MGPELFSMAFLTTILAQSCFSSEIEKRGALEVVELDPIQQALLNQQLNEIAEEEVHGDRDKRLGIIKSVGIKAILLNHIFNKIDRFVDYKTSLVKRFEAHNKEKNEKYFGFLPPPQQKPTPSRRPTTSTPAPVNFAVSSPVSLVIPDRLYGNSFSLITNISEAIGDVLFNTADRAQEFADRLSERTRRKLGFATKLLTARSPKNNDA